MFDLFILSVVVFFISNKLNAVLSQLTSVPVTTDLGGRRVVTGGMDIDFADFLINHNSLIKFRDCFENRRSGAILIHMGHNCGMFLERDMAPNVKIVTTLLGLPYMIGLEASLQMRLEME